MIVTDLEELIVRHEGMILHPYNDTVGKLTIGVGRNLSDNGITEEEARFLLHNDLYTALETARALVPKFDTLSRPRQLVVASMAFNLGQKRLAGFKKMLTALQVGDYSKAADEMLNSAWAVQVGNRSHELAAMMRGNLSTEV